MRPIDADVISYVQSESGCQDDYALRYDINELPTIDLIKAAGGCRCGECRFAGKTTLNKGHIFCAAHQTYKKMDGYCDDGAPREAQDDA